MDKLKLDKKEQTLTKTLDGVEVDLSAIAKGYGVDRVALALEKIGIISYMVEVGGEIRVRGLKNEKTPWLLAIEEPVPYERKLHATLNLSETGAALATSGDYRNFRELDGKLVSHTFDPRSGGPVPRRTASVSVVRPTAAEADGLATALSVLEPERAIAVANAHDWAVYMLIHRDGGKFDARMSEAFKRVEWQKVDVQ
jgi:thiamine biosynthesis lipoprotein